MFRFQCGGYIRYGGVDYQCYFLLDSGCEIPIIDTLPSNVLKLPYDTVRMTTVTFDAEKKAERKIVNQGIEILNYDKSFSITMNRAMISDLSSGKSSGAYNMTEVNRFKHFQGISFPKFDNKAIGVIIPVQFAYTWILPCNVTKSRRVETDQENYPFAFKCK